MSLLKQHILDNSAKRLFCFVNLMQTHEKYNPPPLTRNKFIRHSAKYEDYYKKLSGTSAAHYYAVEPFSKEFLEYLKLRYEEEILYLDIVITDMKLPDISGSGIPDKVQPERIMCFSYGPFTNNRQTEDLIAWFQDHRVAVQQRLETEKENQLFWIYLKPQASRDSAIQAIEDLKSKGIIKKDDEFKETVANFTEE